MICFGLLILIFLLAPLDNALGEILYVPYHYLSIQEAILASRPGDTILVSSGIHRLYSGNIIISKSSITLRSTSGARETIIEGMEDTPVITVGNNIRDCMIDGFTITSTGSNSKSFKGGGIYLAHYSSAIIKNNIITGNSVAFGGGIFCDSFSSPTITGNIISQNEATDSGGGIFSYQASPTISDNKIHENTASIGGAIYCYKDSSYVNNNIIVENTASMGGAIFSRQSSCVIINDTIARNVAVYGGGMFYDQGPLRIINTILWDNRDDIYSVSWSMASRPQHSNISDGDFRGLNGNISSDPLFIDWEQGDFRLRSDSPCIDAGDPSPSYYDPDGSRNDMGAYGGVKPYTGGTL